MARTGANPFIGIPPAPIETMPYLIAGVVILSFIVVFGACIIAGLSDDC